LHPRDGSFFAGIHRVLRVGARYFQAGSRHRRAPAASKAQVRGVGPAGKTVMVDMIAVTQ
jgi:hypothetical protein